jgi:peptide chain release factor 2
MKMPSLKDVKSRIMKQSVAMRDMINKAPKIETKTLTIIFGDMGKECKDFGKILAKMYTLWSEKKLIKCSTSQTKRSIVLTFKGQGFSALDQENGVYRLSRISPFDPEKRRYISFCKVVIDDKSDTEWGEPIRLIILDPDSRVVNTVNGKETFLAEEYLGGDLELIWD